MTIMAGKMAAGTHGTGVAAESSHLIHEVEAEGGGLVLALAFETSKATPNDTQSHNP